MYHSKYPVECLHSNKNAIKGRCSHSTKIPPTENTAGGIKNNIIQLLPLQELLLLLPLLQLLLLLLPLRER